MKYTFGAEECWWSNFKERRPNISKQQHMLERNRAEVLNPIIVNEHFKLHGKILDNHCKNKPKQIYNCDDTFLLLRLRKKSVNTKGTKSTYCQSYGRSEQVTLLVAYQQLEYPTHSPMITRFRIQKMHSMHEVNLVGHITELFLVWMKNIFLVPERSPVPLLTDGH